MYHTVTPIYNGSFDIRLTLDKAAPHLHLEDVPSYLFLIMGEDGKAVVVDTGFNANHVPGLHPVFRRSESQDIVVALESHGVLPGTVEQVVMTHLHWDHTGGMCHFPNATFIVQAGEFQAFTDLKPNEETYYAPHHFIPCLDRMQLINGDKTARPGIRLIFTGRHTRGHQIVRVETRQGPIFLLGDAPFNYDDLWRTVSKRFWDIYRHDEKTRRFYWSTKTQNTLQTFIRENGINRLEIPQPAAKKTLLHRGDTAYTSHDPGLRQRDGSTNSNHARR